jgi:hypothetical protein
LTSTTTSGGKDRRTTPPGAVLETGEAFGEEALAPLAHDLPGKVEALADLLVLQALGGEEDHLRSHHEIVR